MFIQLVNNLCKLTKAISKPKSPSLLKKKVWLSLMLKKVWCKFSIFVEPTLNYKNHHSVLSKSTKVCSPKMAGPKTKLSLSALLKSKVAKKDQKKEGDDQRKVLVRRPTSLKNFTRSLDWKIWSSIKYHKVNDRSKRSLESHSKVVRLERLVSVISF